MDESRFFAYRIVGLVAIIKLIVTFMREHKGTSWGDDKNLLWYQEQHPELVTNGRVTCAHCGGDNVTIRDIANTWRAVLNSHVCQSCGSELYRSKTPR